MTIRAIANVTNVAMEAGFYLVGFVCYATDGTIIAGIDAGDTISIAFTSTTANHDIRSFLASKILSEQGWTIAPSDIYIPFSNLGG
jgi:hypothetical protein